MHPIRMMACALLLPAARWRRRRRRAGRRAGEAGDLSGLWQAKRRFGPDASGTLIVDPLGQCLSGRHGRDGWCRCGTSGASSASICPAIAAAFRGRLQGRGILRGHWFRPGTASDSRRYASPVVLRAAGHRPLGRRGRAACRTSSPSILLMRAAPDGSFDAVLRNPERDHRHPDRRPAAGPRGRCGAADRAARRRTGARARRAAATMPRTGPSPWPFRAAAGPSISAATARTAIIYPRGRKPGALHLSRAAAARRRLADRHAGRGRDRPRGDGAAGPDDRRDADGFGRRAADPRLARRPPRPAGARGIFPRLQPRPAPRHALGQPRASPPSPSAPRSTPARRSACPARSTR